VNPAVLLSLANATRRRRHDDHDSQSRSTDAKARRVLTGAGIVLPPLSAQQRSELQQLVGAASRIGDALHRGAAPGPAAVETLNRLAAGSTGRMRLRVDNGALVAETEWHDATPVALPARLVISEIGEIDPRRLRQCARRECSLLFYDQSRPGTQRWHAEAPCGWLERQRRHRRPPGPAEPPDDAHVPSGGELSGGAVESGP
jgi:predicted RNA-binding Zn ribbon-like protein